MNNHITQLDSQNKTILIFSDPHQDWRKIKNLLGRETYDYVICAGDWFDSHINDTFQDVVNTSALLRKSVGQSNFIKLFGNHDLPYFYFGQNKFVWCSGYSNVKHDKIDAIFDDARQAIIDGFQWYVFVDDFLITHAGLSSHFLNPNHDIKQPYMIEWLNSEIKKANIALASGSPFWFYQAGLLRGGLSPKGGITWLDEREFEPIDGLKQIMGHTAGKYIRPNQLEGALDPNDWQNIWIDCFMKEYLIIKNKKVEVRKYDNL